METHRIVHTWGIKRAYQPREGRREQTFLGRKERRTNKDVSENSVRDEQRVQVRIRREIKLKFGEKKKTYPQFIYACICLQFLAQETYLLV